MSISEKFEVLYVSEEDIQKRVDEVSDAQKELIIMRHRRWLMNSCVLAESLGYSEISDIIYETNCRPFLLKEIGNALEQELRDNGINATFDEKFGFGTGKMKISW